jgi:hypothetical protein
VGRLIATALLALAAACSAGCDFVRDLFPPTCNVAVEIRPGSAAGAVDALRASVGAENVSRLGSSGVEIWRAKCPSTLDDRLRASGVIGAFDRQSAGDARELGVVVAESELPAEAKAAFARYKARRTLKVGYVRLPPGPITRAYLEAGFEGRSFRWRLYDDLALPLRTLVTFTRPDKPRQGWFAEILPQTKGHAAPTRHGVALAWSRGATLFARFQDGNKVYLLRPLGDRYHAVIELDSKDPPADEVVAQDSQQAACAMPSSPPPPASDAPCEPGTPGTAGPVSVGMVFTKGALGDLPDMGAPWFAGTYDAQDTAQAGPEQFAEYLVWLTNVSFAESRIKARVQLSGSIEEGALEQYYQDMGDVLDKLIARDGAYGTRIGAWRDQTASDIVVVVSNLQWAGGKPAAGASPNLCHSLKKEFAYSVVNIWDAETNLSLLHEMGHLFGAQHDPSDSRPARFAWGRGFHAPGCGWRTIMAYPDIACGKSDMRVALWSNCMATYNSVMPGSNAQNNARVIEENAAAIAAYYP